MCENFDAKYHLRRTLYPHECHQLFVTIKATIYSLQGSQKKMRPHKNDLHIFLQEFNAKSH